MSTKTDKATQLLDQLRQVLSAVETGELAPKTHQVAWLRGGIAALEQLDQPAPIPPSVH